LSAVKKEGIEKSENDTDHALFRVSQRKQDRRNADSQHTSHRVLPEHFTDPRRKVAAIRRLLTEGSQCPRQSEQDQQHCQVALQAHELTQVLSLTGQMLQDRHREAQLHQIPADGQDKDSYNHSSWPLNPPLAK
jgi:hypothetical protein